MSVLQPADYEGSASPLAIGILWLLLAFYSARWIEKRTRRALDALLRSLAVTA